MWRLVQDIFELFFYAKTFLLLSESWMKLCAYVCVCVYIYIYMLKFSRSKPGVVQRLGIDVALLFHDRGTRRGWVVSSTPRPHFHPGKNRYPFHRRLDGPQVWTKGADNLVTTGIRSRTVQPVVSRYNRWATRPTHRYVYVYIHIDVCIFMCVSAYIYYYLWERVCVCVSVCVCV